MKNFEETTLSSIALEHHEVIPVMEKYSLDFCCRGNKTLSQACVEKNISPEIVAEEMRNVSAQVKQVMPFAEMTVEQLVSYIMIKHHFYVKQTIPTIMNMLEKITTKHGPRYPNMYRVFDLFCEVKEDLEPHMQKEEQVLFPRIKEIAALGALKSPAAHSPAYIIAPIAMMQTEHDIAGQLMFEIRELTNNYTAPEEACTTHRVCLETLKAFEEDLHQHVHLENNILFPMAISLMNMN